MLQLTQASLYSSLFASSFYVAARELAETSGDTIVIGDSKDTTSTQGTTATPTATNTNTSNTGTTTTATPKTTDTTATNTQTEPAKTEPAKTEPTATNTQTEPTKTEPAKTEPSKTEPAKTEPAKTEQTKTEPTKTDTTTTPKPAEKPKEEAKSIVCEPKKGEKVSDKLCFDNFGNNNCCMNLTIVGYTGQRTKDNLSEDDLKEIKKLSDMKYHTEIGKSMHYCQDRYSLKVLLNGDSNNNFVFQNVPLQLQGYCNKARDNIAGGVLALATITMAFAY